MATEYKSKNTDYMTHLRDAIFRGMNRATPEERTYTWDYVRKQVVLDDLHSFAINSFGKLVEFPVGNYNAQLMIVFLNKPTGPEMEVVKRTLKARLIDEKDVYITWFNKVADADTQNDQTGLQKILNSEISVINPELILSFGLNFDQNLHKLQDFKNAKLMVTYSLKYVFEPDENTVEEKKKWLWNDMIELLKHYKMP